MRGARCKRERERKAAKAKKKRDDERRCAHSLFWQPRSLCLQHHTGIYYICINIYRGEKERERERERADAGGAPRSLWLRHLHDARHAFPCPALVVRQTRGSKAMPSQQYWSRGLTESTCVSSREEDDVWMRKGGSRGPQWIMCSVTSAVSSKPAIAAALDA